MREEEGDLDDEGTPESSAAQSDTPARQAVGPKAEDVHPDRGDEVEADLGRDPMQSEVADAVHPEPSATSEELNTEADPGCNRGVASRTRSKAQGKDEV